MELRTFYTIHYRDIDGPQYVTADPTGYPFECYRPAEQPCNCEICEPKAKEFNRADEAAEMAAELIRRREQAKTGEAFDMAPHMVTIKRWNWPRVALPDLIRTELFWANSPEEIAAFLTANPDKE